MGKDRKARFKRQVTPVGAMERCIFTYFYNGPTEDITQKGNGRNNSISKIFKRFF